MDSGGKGPATRQVPRSRVGVPGVVEPRAQGTKRREPEGGAAERDRRRKQETRKRDFRRPTGKVAASVCRLGDMWVSPAYGWNLNPEGPRPWTNCRGHFPHVSSFFHWPREAIATCPVLTGVAGSSPGVWGLWDTHS